MRAPRGAGNIAEFADSRCVHKDGREVWLSWLGVWSEPAKRFFFVGRDMTESRRAQETLRESEQLARGIIDTALDAFVQMDEQRAISDWNSQAEKMFGWSHSEALGKQLGELIIPESTATRTPPAWSDSCAPEKARSSAAASKSRRGGATARNSRSN